MDKPFRLWHKSAILNLQGCKPTESNNLDDIKLLLKTDGKFVVYPNNKDVNEYDSYENVKSYISTFINKNEFLCNGLDPDYILKSFDKVDAVL
jgi:hypothetical protein